MTVLKTLGLEDDDGEDVHLGYDRSGTLLRGAKLLALY
jgi:hypothetical protein